MHAPDRPLTVVAASAAEAMARIKAELGEDAVLLGQRALLEAEVVPAHGGAASVFHGSSLEDALAEAEAALGRGAALAAQREVVELTAVAADAEDETEAEPLRPSAGTGQRGGFLSKVYGVSAAGGDAGTPGASGRPDACPWPPEPRPERRRAPAGGGGDASLESICERLGAIERLVRRTDRPHVPEPLCEAYCEMVENEVTEEIARGVVERLGEELPPAALARPERLREALVRAVARLIPVEGPIRRREDGRPAIVAVVGPTGVGKTTSIAKLATRFRVQDRLKVGLVSEDTTRPGGAEQLRSVAQLLSVPLAVADTVDRLRAAIQRGRDLDVILIDTAGRAPRGEGAISELAAFLRAVRPDETHLAVCSHSSLGYVQSVLERFRPVGFDRILLTKLDEAATHGLVLNVAAAVDRGLSYVTTGQDYMESIEPGDPERLAALVLGCARAADGAPGDDGGSAPA